MPIMGLATGAQKPIISHNFNYACSQSHKFYLTGEQAIYKITALWNCAILI